MGKFLGVITVAGLLLAAMAATAEEARAEDAAPGRWATFGACLMFDGEACKRSWDMETGGIRRIYHGALYRKAINDDNPETALRHIDALVSLDPEKPTVHIKRAWVLEELRDWSGAADAYRTALLLGYDGLEIYRDLGWVLIRTGDYDSALKYANTRVDLDPDNINAYGLRSGAYGQLGRVDEAMADADLALRRWPDNAEAYNLKCWTLTRFFARHEEAMPYCEKSLELWPDYPPVLHSRGYAYMMMGEKQKAVSDFSLALELLPGNYVLERDLERALALPD